MPTRRIMALTGLLAIFFTACTTVIPTDGGRTPAPPVPATSPAGATATPEITVLPPAVLLVQQTLAGALGLPPQQVALAGLEAVDWPDSCLGAPRADEACAEVITPGYRMEFETPLGRYVIHTDQAGGSLRQVAPALDGTPAPGGTETPVLPSREPPPPGSGGIEGQVLIGPACPGPVTVDAPCPDQPFQATLTILTTQNAAVGQVTTDVEGRFRMSLAPGTYIVRPEPPKRGIAFAPDQPVTVVAGEFASLEIVYDSGMR